MRPLLFAFTFILFLTGCGAESDAKKAVLKRLKDPDSAKFGQFMRVGENACMTVNARNSMGGYTGDQQATLKLINNEWEVEGINEISHDGCISIIKNLEQSLEQQRLVEVAALEQQKLQNALVKKQTEEQLKRCSVIKNCFEMVMVPGGSFEIGVKGSTHKLELKAFALGKTEITQGQWHTVMGVYPSFSSECDTCPVANVSWDDVQIFIQTLNAKTDGVYRLPTEAEWEFACYGGHTTEYCGGNDADSVAWYNVNSGIRKHPVGQKQANGYGLYDMSGNVWELMQDCYDGDCVGRVLRGGSSSSYSYSLLATERKLSSPDDRDNQVGFRVASSKM